MMSVPLVFINSFAEKLFLTKKTKSLKVAIPSLPGTKETTKCFSFTCSPVEAELSITTLSFPFTRARMLLFLIVLSYKKRFITPSTVCREVFCSFKHIKFSLFCFSLHVPINRTRTTVQFKTVELLNP